MAKPCALFWDIQKAKVPIGKSTDFIVDLIRSTIIKPYNLDEIFFFCICDAHRLFIADDSMLNLDVQAYNGFKDSADNKIMDLMRKFVKVAGKDCTIILLSGGAGYYGTLSDLKKLHNVSIYLIRLDENSWSHELKEISDYTFIFINDQLERAKPPSMCFISIKNYPLSANISQVVNELNTKAIGSIENSAIIYDSSIYIGFSTLENAAKAIQQLNGSRYHRLRLRAELINESPLTDMLKKIKIEKSKKSKANKCCEVKQLTFIKIANESVSVDNSKFIKFCVACTAPTGSQCILSRESSLWVVFSFRSHAQDCLSKFKILYPDAVISEPPPGLTLPYLDKPYTVQFCDEQNIVSITREKPYASSNTALYPTSNLNSPSDLLNLRASIP